MKNAPNQSLVGMIRQVDVKPPVSESNMRISVVDQRDQSSLQQSNRGKENPASPNVQQNSQIRIASAPVVRGSAHSSSFCASLLSGSTAAPTPAMEKHGVRISTNSHNKLADRLLRKNSRFLSQLTEWLEQPGEKAEDEGAISLDEGVQDMLEGIMCDFVVEMMQGACRTARLRRNVLTTTNSDQQEQRGDSDTEKMVLQSAQHSVSPTISDVVFHAENRLGIDVPRILLALHHVPNPDQQPRRRVPPPAEWHKQRIISTKKSLRSDGTTASGAHIEPVSAMVLTANDFFRNPITSTSNSVGGNLCASRDGSAALENEDDF